MKKALLIALAVGTMLATVAPADARDGCGPGGHRDGWGHCRPNGYGPGPGVFIGVGGPRIGVFYPGRGYWDGHRYRVHREHWHGGWRYR